MPSPHADLRKGEIFLRQVVTALANGPDWSKTVLVINRDEWGGFFDHVVPPRVIAPNAVDTDLVDGKVLLGCRVPVVVVSPFTRGNPDKPRIDFLVYDHTSVLKLIEWRWQLAPLTSRDASNEIANLVHALDLNQQGHRVARSAGHRQSAVGTLLQRLYVCRAPAAGSGDQRPGDGTGEPDAQQGCR
jgi:phospholipase C